MSSILDIVFVIDTTESMTDHWQFAMKHWLPDFVRSASTLLETAKGIPFDVQFACVSFNDYLDGLTPSPHLQDTGCVVCPLTSDHTAFLAKLQTGIFLFGGGDSPEDLIGGLLKVQELHWRPGSKRLAFLLTDAPCHGMEFHNVTDNYPTGDPKGRSPADALARLGQLGICLIFMRCGRLPDLMIEAFRSLRIRLNFYLLECWDWVNEENQTLALEILFWVLCYVVQIPQTLKMQCINLVQKHEFFQGLVIKPYYLPQELMELLADSPLCFEQPPRHLLTVKRGRKKRKQRFQELISSLKKKLKSF